MNKPCTVCKLVKPFSEFYKCPRLKSGLKSECKICSNAKVRAWLEAHPRERQIIASRSDAIHKKGRRTRRKVRAPELFMLSGARERAKEKGLPYSITSRDIPIPEKCPILGIPLFINLGGKGGSKNSPTIDRIIPELGYVPGNVWVISKLANMMKSCATEEELLHFANWILTGHKKEAA